MPLTCALQIGRVQRQALRRAVERVEKRVLVGVGVAHRAAHCVAGGEQLLHHVLRHKTVGTSHNTNRHSSSPKCPRAALFR